MLPRHITMSRIAHGFLFLLNSSIILHTFGFATDCSVFVALARGFCYGSIDVTP